MSSEDVNSLLGRGLWPTAGAGPGTGHSRGRHSAQSRQLPCHQGSRARGFPGPARGSPLPMHPLSQPHAFPKGQASPRERASAGWAVRGEFSSISSPQSDTGWWPPGGEKGLEGGAGVWGRGRGSSGLEGSSSAGSLVGLPAGAASRSW